MVEESTIPAPSKRTALDLEIDRLWHVAAASTDPDMKHACDLRRAALVERRTAEQPGAV